MTVSLVAFRRRLIVGVLSVVGACAAAATQAANVAYRALDPSGRALDSVVIALLPASRANLPTPRPARIEQVRKSFMPQVSAVQVGTAIEFPNNDTVRHHVYSFSPAKVFELKLYSGRPEKPVVFDKPGLVVLGCNIHDQMVAYVSVVDTPWFAVTGSDGSAQIRDVPFGDYQVQVWHPRRLGQPDLPLRPLRVAGDLSETLAVELKP
ncbi:methylamine utilization protein [Methyloversatilis universalis]|uniref:methylamine utilization protein n=1 Tax=Methyloversatilis universalis TaxID=378211 RepID=UPI0003698FA2|nr:methylamine utilization protein [Methyloversatilis universalis]